MDFREDFDRKRRLKAPSLRLKKIEEAMKKRKSVPAIEVYKIRDEYYEVGNV